MLPITNIYSKSLKSLARKLLRVQHKPTKGYNYRSLVVLSMVIISSLSASVAVFIPQPAQAQTAVSSVSADKIISEQSSFDTDKTMTYAYYMAMDSCYYTNGDDSWRHIITVPDGIPNSGQSTSPNMKGDNAAWFYGKGSEAYIPNEGKVSCNQIFETGLSKYFGYGTNYYQYLKDMGYSSLADNGTFYWKVGDADGNKAGLEANYSSTMRSRLKQIVIDKNLVDSVYLSSYATQEAESAAIGNIVKGNYLLNAYAFKSQCVPDNVPIRGGSGELGLYSNLTPEEKTLVDNGGTITSNNKVYKYIKLNIANGMSIANNAYIYQSKNGNNSSTSSDLLARHNNTISLTCDDIVINIESLTGAYVNNFVDKVSTEVCKELGLATGSEAKLNACKSGFKYSDNSSFCQQTYINGVSQSGSYDQEAYNACVLGAQTSAAATNSSTSCDPNALGCGVVPATSEAKSSCAIDGIGWLLCPVVNFMAGVVDQSYKIVGTLLTTPAVNVDTNDQENGTYQAWKIMQSIANVAFVIAFLIIIFSQLTSAGISSYGVKKTLPRLVIAAILVNVSYYVSAIAVDISNILGQSLVSMFDSISAQIVTPDFSSLKSTGNGWTGLVAVAMATGGVALSGGVLASMAAILPVLISGLIAIVTVFLVLMLRQALIIILIVVSPLAFVAFLLPNTEQLFKKWRSMFQTMLLMFPIIAVIFGGSALASKIIMASDPGFFVQIMGAGVALIPLFISPIVMKSAGGLLNNFAGMVKTNGLSKAGIGKMQDGAKRFKENQDGRGKIRALSDKKFFGSGKYRRDAKRDAVSSGIKGEASRSSTDFIADKVEGDENFRNAVAGGTRLPGGQASEEALMRARASALSAQDKAEHDETTAARIVLSKMGLGETDLRALEKGQGISVGGKSYQGGSLQRAALSNAFDQQRFKHIEDAAMSTTMQPEAREHMAKLIDSNFAIVKSKAIHLVDPGVTDELKSGNVVTDAQMNQSASDQAEKITANDLSTQQDYARIERAKASGTPLATSNLRATALQVESTPQLAANVSGDRQAAIGRIII